MQTAVQCKTVIPYKSFSLVGSKVKNPLPTSEEKIWTLVDEILHYVDASINVHVSSMATIDEMVKKPSVWCIIYQLRTRWKF